MSRAKRAKTRVGELNEQRWSVVSERGREAAGLTYVEAAGLVRQLLGEKVHGTCVITDEAAARLNGSASKAGGNGNNTAATPAKKTRARRKARGDADAGS